MFRSRIANPPLRAVPGVLVQWIEEVGGEETAKRSISVLDSFSLPITPYIHFV